jgi:hypothetical protein
MHKRRHDGHCGKNPRVSEKECSRLKWTRTIWTHAAAGKIISVDQRGRNVIIQLDRQSSARAKGVTAR